MLWATPPVKDALTQTLVFHPSGKQIYSPGGTNVIDVRNAVDGSLADQIVVPRQNPKWSESISGITISSSGRHLAAVSGGSTEGYQIVAISTADKKVVFQVGNTQDVHPRPPGQTFYCASFHPKLDVLAVGTGDGLVTLYQVPSGKVIKKFQGHMAAARCLAWSGGGDRLLSGSADGTALFWDTGFLVMAGPEQKGAIQRPAPD